MKIIPFDVEKAKSGKYKIQTKDGKSVRIVCWDKKTKENIKLVGLMDLGDFEEPFVINENDNSLVLVDESFQTIEEKIDSVFDGFFFEFPRSTVILKEKLLSILPKWKPIKKGEVLPERAYVKFNDYIVYVPANKGAEFKADGWYLPVTAIDELDCEI